MKVLSADITLHILLLLLFLLLLFLRLPLLVAAVVPKN
jgi:hypothetical protein